MRRLVLLAAMLVLASGLAGAATASEPGTQHLVVSHAWRGITFVGGLDSCPVFGPNPGSPSYVFDDVELRDHVNSRFSPTPLDPSGLLWQIDSVGELHGVIHTTNGTYTVAGGGFREDRVGQLAPWYFAGTGHATITGPGGTVVGEATFLDLIEFPPSELDLVFSSITACRLS
jgi:hypothetical protein